jgi:sortase A
MKSFTKWWSVERVLSAVGCILLAYGTVGLAKPRLMRIAPTAASNLQALSTVQSHSSPVPPIRASATLDIPRLRFSATVVEGDEDQGLEFGAVHLAGTAELGGMGNAVVAGHRDTVFRPLQYLRIGDVIEVAGEKKHTFTVKTIQVVDATDVTVLKSDLRSILTLVTCYPFRYIGSAPKRFVVKAERTG